MMFEPIDSNTSDIFQQFKKQLSSAGGSLPSHEEEAFMKQIIPRVQKMARWQLTNDVRRTFDTSDITSTVMRRLVGFVRKGKLSVSTEGQFMSLLKQMTKNAIIEKHDYLTRLLRDQTRNQSLEQFISVDYGSSHTDLTAADDERRHVAGLEVITPVEELLLAERQKELQDLCEAVRAQLQPDEWHLFKRRFLEEAPWSIIAEELGLPSAETARMRTNRLMNELRPRMVRYQEWLRSRPV